MWKIDPKENLCTQFVQDKVPVLELSAVVTSLLSPLTPSKAPGGTGAGPAGATALGGRFPGTFTVTRSRSISFPWVFWV